MRLKSPIAFVADEQALLYLMSLWLGRAFADPQTDFAPVVCPDVRQRFASGEQQRATTVLRLP